MRDTFRSTSALSPVKSSDYEVLLVPWDHGEFIGHITLWTGNPHLAERIDTAFNQTLRQLWGWRDISLELYPEERGSRSIIFDAVSHTDRDAIDKIKGVVSAALPDDFEELDAPSYYPEMSSVWRRVSTAHGTPAGRVFPSNAETPD